MKKHSFLYSFFSMVAVVFFSSILVNCSGGDKGELVFVDKSARGPSSEIKAGEVLYANRCASCHGPIETSTKIGRTFTQINDAIDSGSIAQMTGPQLTSLTDIEIASIAKALDRPFPPGPPQTLKFKQVVGTRLYIVTKFKGLFSGTGQSDGEKQIVTLSDALIRQPGFLGGKCSHLEYCSNFFGINQHEDADAPVQPLPSVTRRGVITKACQEILSIDEATTNVLALAGLSTSSPGDEANIIKLFNVINPTTIIDSKSSNGLIGIHQEAKNNQNMSDLEAWKMVVYTLCVSPTFETI